MEERMSYVIILIDVILLAWKGNHEWVKTVKSWVKRFSSVLSV
jgi:hypothetical protein